MKILFVASECIPFCKTGGLADVVGALPKELRKKRHDVRIILPKYKTIRSQEFGVKEMGEKVRVPIGDRWEEGDLRAATTEKGIKVYFINHEKYFGRAGLYRAPHGDYADNAERFIFFARAALEACKAIEFRPDVIHCHDWQTGLVPVYLKQYCEHDAFFQHTVSVFTIHNIAYQGIFPKETLKLAGLPESEFVPSKLEYYNQVSFLKAGLVYSHALTTVSPTYAHQIQSSAAFGRGLEGVLRERSKDLVGILNGLDQDEWNPAKDPFLPKPFEMDDLGGRRDCKASLQQALRLPVRARTPLLGMVARLDWQKGVDLLTAIIPDLVALGAQLVVLGNGDLELQRSLEGYAHKHPQNVHVHTDFNDPLAHQIYGGSDMFLMPSRFEPCGLSQMIAMRYGSIPIVAGTGGLMDTVTPVGKDTGTGFMFYELTPTNFFHAIQKALVVYANPASWGRLQKRAINANFSWEASAQAYLAVYRRGQKHRTDERHSLRVS